MILSDVTTSRLLRAAGFLLGAVLWTAPAQAQFAPGANEGFFVDGHTGASRLVLEEDDARWGLGIGGRVGYGFSDRFALFFRFYGASIEDVAENRFPTDNDNAGLGIVGLGAEVFLPSPGRVPLVPYLSVAYSRYAAAFDDGGDDDTFVGAGPTIGAGVRYYTAPRIALFLGAHYTSGSFTENADGDGISDVEAQALRISGGVIAYPFR